MKKLILTLACLTNIACFADVKTIVLRPGESVLANVNGELVRILAENSSGVSQQMQTSMRMSDDQLVAAAQSNSLGKCHIVMGGLCGRYFLVGDKGYPKTTGCLTFETDHEVIRNALAAGLCF